MGLAQDLYTEYQAKKKEIIEKYCPDGKGVIPSSAIKEMNTRECAGSFLASFGMKSLTAFDSLPDYVREKYAEAHPGIRELLEKACAASLIMSH